MVSDSSIDDILGQSVTPFGAPVDYTYPNEVDFCQLVGSVTSDCRFGSAH